MSTIKKDSTGKHPTFEYHIEIQDCLFHCFETYVAGNDPSFITYKNNKMMQNAERRTLFGIIYVMNVKF